MVVCVEGVISILEGVKLRQAYILCSSSPLQIEDRLWLQMVCIMLTEILKFSEEALIKLGIVFLPYLKGKILQ